MVNRLRQVPGTQETSSRPIWVHPAHRIPPEGEDDIFRQSWYPICLSRDLAIGGVRGEDFLGGRIAVYRTGDGEARVMSAFCPHLGADLGRGEVVEDRLRCPFHKW